MLDHEEKFLFKEETLHLANALAEPGVLDNVEDLLTDVITSPRSTPRSHPGAVTSGDARRPCGGDAGRPADGDAGGLRRDGRSEDPARSAGAPGRLARAIWPGHRQCPQLPEQPRRDPGSQLLDAGRPRGRAASAAGPADAGSLQQRAAVFPGRRERLSASWWTSSSGSVHTSSPMPSMQRQSAGCARSWRWSNARQAARG